MKVFRQPRTWWVLLGSVALCALFVGGLLRLGARDAVLRLLDWLDVIGLWGPVLFVLIEIVVVVLLLPGILFTLGAGFLFGPWWGTVYVVLGNALGATVAFLAARTLLRGPVRRLLKKHETLQNLDRRASDKGWRLVMLTRMIPFFPFKLSNYLFGVMRFTVRDFLVGTAVGSIPIAATNVYAGSLAQDLATMESLGKRSPLAWGVSVGGLLLLIAVTALLGRIAGRQVDLGDDA